MTCTTFLHDSELNLPLPNQEIQQIFDAAKKQHGMNWQIVPIHITKRKWFKKRTETLYGVYVYVGGIGPWQQINFYRDVNHGSSIQLYVPLEIVAAYFLGMLATAKSGAS